MVLVASSCGLATANADTSHERGGVARMLPATVGRHSCGGESCEQLERDSRDLHLVGQYLDSPQIISGPSSLAWMVTSFEASPSES